MCPPKTNVLDTDKEGSMMELMVDGSVITDQTLRAEKRAQFVGLFLLCYVFGVDPGP